MMKTTLVGIIKVDDVIKLFGLVQKFSTLTFCTMVEY